MGSPLKTLLALLAGKAVDAVVGKLNKPLAPRLTDRQKHERWAMSRKARKSAN